MQLKKGFSKTECIKRIRKVITPEELTADSDFNRPAVGSGFIDGVAGVVSAVGMVSTRYDERRSLHDNSFWRLIIL